MRRAPWFLDVGEISMRITTVSIEDQRWVSMSKFVVDRTRKGVRYLLLAVSSRATSTERCSA